MLIIINFHYIRPVFHFPYQGIQGITPAQLKRQLVRLQQWGRFINAAELEDLCTGKACQPNEVLLLATLDDGLREQYTYGRPVFKQLGIAPVYFVNPANMEEGKFSAVHQSHLLRSHIAPIDLATAMKDLGYPVYLSTEEVAQAKIKYRYDDEPAAIFKYWLNYHLNYEIREWAISRLFRHFGLHHQVNAGNYYMTAEMLHTLAAEGELGSHGYEHWAMGLLSDEDAFVQMTAAKDWLEKTTGFGITLLSYPYGDDQAVTVASGRLARQAGYRGAITMERAANGLPIRNPYRLARFSCSDLPEGNFPLFRYAGEIKAQNNFSVWNPQKAGTNQIY